MDGIIIEYGDGGGQVSYRNEHALPELDDLEQMFIDVWKVSLNTFQAIYGDNVYPFRGADNSFRVSCEIPRKVKPYVRHPKMKHRTPIRKGDFVVFDSFDGNAKEYGIVCWVNTRSDECGIRKLGADGEYDVYSPSDMDSVREAGKVRWRICI